MAIEVSFTFSLPIENKYYQYTDKYIVDIDNLFNVRDDSNNFFVWLMYKFVNGKYEKIRKRFI